MGAATTYEVWIRYQMEDRASAKAAGLGKALRGAADGGNALDRTLARVGATAAGLFGIGAAKTALIDFNSTMEQSRIQMAGMISLNKGGDWTSNLQKATDLVGELQLKARDSVGTTQDMVTMASSLVRPLLAAKLSMADLRDMTAQTVVASKAFGVEAGVAARDVEQALMGTFSTKDMFARKILEPLGYTGTEGRGRYNKLSEEQRAAEFKRGLAHPAIQEMAKAQANSYAGVVSTLEDNIQMALGKVGLPLFKAITAEIKTWNGWLDQNRKSIEGWSKTISDGLMSGFKGVKEVFRFISENKQVLLDIAKAWLVGKGVGAIVSGVTGIFSAFTGGLSSATNALAALAVATVALADQWGESQYKENVKREEIHNMGRTAWDYSQDGDKQSLNMLRKNAKEMGLVNDKGRINERKAWGMLGFASMEEAQAKEQYLRDNFMRDKANELAQSIIDVNNMLSVFKDTVVDADKAMGKWKSMVDGLENGVSNTRMPWDMIPGKNKVAERQNINVTIQHIEVKSDDPDRFTFGLAESLRDMARNPSSAMRSIRET